MSIAQRISLGVGLIVTVQRAQHHSVLAERDWLPILVSRDMSNSQSRHRKLIAVQRHEKYDITFALATETPDQSTLLANQMDPE
jgi:hypothetical protein